MAFDAQRPTTARASWHGKASRPVLVWFVLLIVLAVVHRWVPGSRWLLVHMFVLGMVTNSILIWSQHFAEALLKNRVGEGDRRAQVRRIRALNLGIVATMTGALTGVWALTLVGAVVIGAVVTWHAVSLMRQMRRALPSRYGTTIRYYIAAALLLPVGAAFGAVLAYGLDEEMHARILLAHQAVNVLGFVGLTVMGTLITLWPTMLRTRMVAGLARAGRWGLAALLGGTVLTAAGALAGWPIIGALGVLVYLDGVGFIGLYLFRCASQNRPNDYPTFSVAASLMWLTGSLSALFVIIVTGPLEPGRLQMLTVPFVAGFMAQVLLGAMSFLMPTVMGGGPAAVRNALGELSRFAMLRIVVINLGLVVFLLSEANWIRVITSVLVLCAYAAFLPLMVRAVKASVAGRKAALSESGTPVRVRIGPSASPQRHLGWAAAGVAVVLAGIGAGIAADPAAVGLNLSGRIAVSATGETTRVQVSARDMQFFPASVEVPAGNRLIIELTNDDPATVHDLALQGGAKSDRLHPGESTTIDAGVMAEDADGWCTVVGHRSMGMTFEVNVLGGSTGEEAAADSLGADAGSDGDDSVPRPVDLSRDPGPDFQAREAALEPAAAGTTHRATFSIEQVKREIAPGLTQEAWTYNGQVHGPTLRGKVGDASEITLVNNGTVGRSIDFHAGAVAPDEAMRTIPSRRIAGIPVPRGTFRHLALPLRHSAGFRPHRLRDVRCRHHRSAEPAAGPLRGTSFHVVGGRFDAVFKEGAYLLKPGSDEQGGSQSLNLASAEGGFVELEFEEDGNYMFLNHSLADAERGAQGMIAVTK